MAVGLVQAHGRVLGEIRRGGRVVQEPAGRGVHAGGIYLRRGVAKVGRGPGLAGQGGGVEGGLRAEAVHRWQAKEEDQGWR